MPSVGGDRSARPPAVAGEQAMSAMPSRRSSSMTARRLGPNPVAGADDAQHRAVSRHQQRRLPGGVEPGEHGLAPRAAARRPAPRAAGGCRRQRSAAGPRRDAGAGMGLELRRPASSGQMPRRRLPGG